MCSCAQIEFFSKFTKMWKSISKTYEDISEGGLVGLIAAKYPDIDEVLETLDEMKAAFTATDSGEEGDDKWRPMILTLGLLYKLQRIYDSDVGSWYNAENIFVHEDDLEKRLLHTLGEVKTIPKVICDLLTIYSSIVLFQVFIGTKRSRLRRPCAV